MGNRFAPLALIALLAVLHAQLWIGRGSIPSVTAMTAQIAEQKGKNERARQANERLSASVRTMSGCC